MKHHFAPALAAADAIVEGKRTQDVCSDDPPTPGAPSKRPGVLLDFGTGTSFSSFAELWNYLLHNGWATSPGKVIGAPARLDVLYWSAGRDLVSVLRGTCPSLVIA